MNAIGKFISTTPPSQTGPHDGAMISPYPPERVISQGEVDAWAALDRAEGLLNRAKREIALAMASDNRADTALQDTHGWVAAILDAELPGARRALDNNE